jgi:hypothetical protein
VPLAYVATETRDDAGVERSFRSERRLGFRKDGNGFVAEVTLLHSDSEAEDRSKIDLRIHLDRTGGVTSVENRDALWERLCAAIEDMAPARKTDHAHAIAAALRKLPPESQARIAGLAADRRR